MERLSMDLFKFLYGELFAGDGNKPISIADSPIVNSDAFLLKYRFAADSTP